MQNNGVAHGNIVDNDDVIIIEDNTAHNNPQEPEILEISDDEVEVLALVKPKRNPQSIQQVSGGVRPKFAVSAAQRSQVRVDLTQSDNVPGVGRMGMEVEETVDDEEDSDVEETNIDTSSTESMLNFIMGTPNEPSTSAAGTAPTTFRTPVGVHQIKKRLTGNPGSSNEPSTSSGSSAPVENPQIKKKLTVHPIAPTPAKRRCLRSTETVQNERARPRSSQENQQCSAGPSSSSAPLKPITADAPSTSESITAPIAQSSSRRSTRTVLVPKESENKENVPKTLEPGPSSASEASSSKPALQRQCPEAETDAGTASTTFRTPIGVQQMKKRLTGNPGISNEPSTSSGSSAPVENPQIKTKLTVHPIAPTPAKRICVRSIETVQNERALPRTSQGNQQNSAGPSTSSASFEAIQVDAPSTSGAGPAPLAQHLPRRSTRTVVAPKESENKENVPETLEPGPSSMQKPGPSPASETSPFNPAPQRQSPKIKKDEKPIEVGSAPKPIAIGAAILGEENKNKIFYFPRTPAVPTGLRRTPFNGELPKDIRRKCEYSKIMRKLKIQKDVNFPKSIPEGKMIKSVLGNEEEKPAKATYPGDPSKNDPKGVATLEKFLGDTPDQAYMNLKDKEEKVWSAEKLEEHLEGDEGRKEAFYRVIEQKYLFAVWRQFESHVPLEYALQNLQKNDYNISLALGSIDKCLKRLPQKTIAPSAAQVKYMATEFEENGEHADLSWIQDNVMRNYHMAEIHGFHYKFMKFFEPREDGNEIELRFACNCRQQLCRPLSFEPRYGCANCTNKMRKHKLPADKLCLLCTTQMDVARRLRPAEKPTFDSDDLEKIKKWDKEVPRMSRTEFEKWMQDQKNERYKKLQLTQEEVLMLDFEKLTVSNLAEQVTAQLQPYVLPHFSRCGCSRNRPVANPPPKIPEL